MNIIEKEDNTQKVFLSENTLDVLEILQENYDYIYESMRQEGFNLKYDECNLFKEIVFDNPLMEIVKECLIDNPKERIEIIHATNTVTNYDNPMEAFYRKEKPSVFLALEKCATDEDAIGVISSGNTGAVLVGAIKYLLNENQLRNKLWKDYYRL